MANPIFLFPRRFLLIRRRKSGGHLNLMLKIKKKTKATIRLFPL
jgi:hypothetical protein